MSISHRLLERRSSSMVRYLRFCIRNNTSYSSTICAKIPYAHFLRLNNTLDGVNYSLSNEYPVSCIFAGLLVKLTNFCLKYTGQTTIEDTSWSTRGQITLPLNFFLICASCCFEIVWFIVANVNFFFFRRPSTLEARIRRQSSIHTTSSPVRWVKVLFCQLKISALISWLCNDRNMILSLMNTWERWLFST